MASGHNKHGLSRDIPLATKLAVRQACGFGCVICGASIIEYEHIDPEFRDAKEHDANAIALLCNSCHGNVTRKFWSKDKVKQARAAPRCKELGFSRGEFDFGDRLPSIRFASALFRGCPVPIMVKGSPMIQIQGPEESGGPFRLSATFCDLHGNAMLDIQANEWRVSAGVWDTEFTGGKILIRQADGEQCLLLRALDFIRNKE